MASLLEAEGLVSSAQSLQLDDVSADVLGHASRVIADTLGVIFGGGKRPEIEALIRGDGRLFFAPAGGTAQLLVPGLPGADPTSAAFVNATAGTFLELDEGYRPTGHPSIHVLPTALAAAQVLHASGRELMATFLSGYEVTACLFEAYRPTYPLHPHGHFGAVGAAVAAACLRGVDALEPAAIAATLPLLPTWQPHRGRDGAQRLHRRGCRRRADSQPPGRRRFHRVARGSGGRLWRVGRRASYL